MQPAVNRGPGDHIACSVEASGKKKLIGSFLAGQKNVSSLPMAHCAGN
jgi:hypothetical protein